MRIIQRPPDTSYEGSMFCLQGRELIGHWHSIVFQESRILNR